MRLGIAEEMRDAGIASNTLWPRTMVATAAVQNLLGGDEAMARSRKPEVYSDAAYAVLSKPAREYTGHTLLCEDVLLESGVTDLSVYDCIPGSELGVDLWVDTPNPPGYRNPERSDLDDGVAAGLLGPVHRLVDPGHRSGGVFAGNGKGGADAQGCVDDSAGILDRFGGPAANRFRDRRDLVEVTDSRQQNEHLVAAGATDRVSVAHTLPDPAASTASTTSPTACP